MRFCPNCGIPVGESPRYCAGCGTPVSPEQPSAAPVGAALVGSGPAGRGPFGSAPLRVGSAPLTWFDALSPVGHPQADGLAGAAPAAPSRRAAPGNRRRPGWSGHRMTIAAMVVTLALVSTAGIATWQVSQLYAQPSAASASLHTQRTGLATGTGHPGSTQPGAHGSAAHMPRASASPPVTRRAIPAAPVGNAVLAVAPLAAHVPHVRQVVALLTTYFESINSQNFAEYQSLFVPSIQRTMSHFGAGYAGTFDSGATLTQLAATGPHGLAATVAFISHQNPANSPDGAGCDSWLITLFLRQQGNALHIRHPRPGFPQSVLACR